MFSRKFKLCFFMFFAFTVQLTFGQSRIMRLYKSDGTVMRSLVVSEIDSINFQETGTVTDIDENIYQTVKIGDQWWMAENLKVTHYRNDDVIPNVTDNTAWGNLTTGAYCAYNNDASSESDTYGYLYNWYAVVDTHNIAPIGWHVPTDAEWTILTTYLGGESVAGGKMKETGTTHWTTPNTGATNESGFSALPGGIRSYEGPYYNMGSQALFWSSTEANSDDAWRRYLNYGLSGISRYEQNKEYGFSVRCLRD